MIDSGAEELGVVFGWHGPAMFSQRGRSVELGFGDAAISLNSEPADLVLPGAMGRHVGLIVPLAPLVGLLRGGDATPQRIPRSNELLRLLWGYLRSLEDNVTFASPELREAVVRHVHDLIALALGASQDGAEIATRVRPGFARSRPTCAPIWQAPSSRLP